MPNDDKLVPGEVITTTVTEKPVTQTETETVREIEKPVPANDQSPEKNP